MAGVTAGLAVAGAVEVDVRATRDGRLVLSHDPIVAGMVIGESSWSELEAAETAMGERLCQLDEAMGVPGRFDLEIKNLPGQPDFDPSGRPALEAASRARGTDIVTSFWWPDMDLVARRAPGVVTGLLVGEGGSLEDAVAYAVAHGHPVVAAHHTLVEAAVAGEVVDAAGLRLMIWTLNDPRRAVQLIESGVAAVVTDRPSTLSTFLQEETSG